MSTLVIFGSQWGDEGKGKIVDIISREADVVARYQGGSNAGHTVVKGDKKYVLHLVPSGIFHPNCKCLIGNGVVVDIRSLEDEIRTLESVGIEVRPHLLISTGAHVVVPYHQLMDAAMERQRGQAMIGTTGRGIGCAYADKAARIGIRMGDLRSEPGLRSKIDSMRAYYDPVLGSLGVTDIPSAREVTDQLLELSRGLAPMLVDGSAWINEQVDTGKRILIEGAQGLLLDIDHGTYPFVTSSNPSPGGVCTGLGISPRKVDRIVAVTKAYITRVGSGPMPTEFQCELGERVRAQGNEFGATTGRPRRCGWFDVPALRRSILVSGPQEIALTKIDVLGILDTLKIATHYRIDGQDVDILPDGLALDTPVEPVYEEMPGWKSDLSSCRNYENLPVNARRYIERLEQLLDVPITLVSVSADHDDTIFRKNDFFA